MLRIIKNRRVSYLSTKMFISPDHWDPQKEIIKRSHPEHAYLNSKLSSFIAAARRIGLNESIEIDKIKSEVESKVSTDFVEYAEGLIESIKKRGQYWNWKNLKTALNKLIEFAGTRNIYFHDINEVTIREFEDWLTDRGNKKNTRHKNLQSLQRIFSGAARERVIRSDDNPFTRIRLSKERVERQKLSLEELKLLIDVEVPADSGQWHAKNIWLFSFFCGGVRFTDLCLLRWKHVQGGRIAYKMSKTGIGKNIEMVPQALKILELYRSKDKKPDDYVFPILRKEYPDPNKLRAAISSRNALVNKDLKKVAEKAGIKTPVSMHISRHTFAVVALASGMDIYSLSKALGHSDLKITQTYLKSFDEKVDTDISKMFKKLKNISSNQ
jgi:site-specific recombinase XerD